MVSQISAFSIHAILHMILTTGQLQQQIHDIN